MEYSFTPAILDRAMCRDFDRSSRLEWLDTNGTGAYAMGTVAGVNTRRHHGLLVAALHAPVQRHVMLAQTGEQAIIAGQTFDLSTCQFPGAVHPRGFENLDSFRLDPFPEWGYQLGDDSFTKSAFLIREKQAVALKYRCSKRCTLRVMPFLAFRMFHDLMHANNRVNGAVEQLEHRLLLRPYTGHPVMSVWHNAERFEPEPCWYRNFEYLMELERGMDYREDLFTPGSLVFELESGQTGYLVASIEPDGDSYNLERVEELSKMLRSERTHANTPFEAKLTAVAGNFLACRHDGRPTVMAGFPWFADWGRDTMVSLPGLLITRGLLGEATKVIESFLFHLDQGLIPNLYPDFGAPEYNTCDATLWMFQAVWSYMICGGNLSWIQRVFYPALKEIIAWHVRGTMYEIKMNPEDGLLSAGVEGTQLTWMDAKVNDWVVTPRHGKPVEVNALWYNALRMGAHWAVEFGDMDYAHRLSSMARQAQTSFADKFWNEEANCLYDVLSPDGPVAKLRPNQIFAVSLPFDLLTQQRQRAVVDIVERELLTPVGLRTLARSDPDYQPRYQGNRLERDGAYHQGTVWPWLLGPFVTAYLKVHLRSQQALERCREIILGMEPELLANGLGAICEIYDGDPPQRPRGCIAQAWSVAELLRVLRTDLI